MVLMIVVIVLVAGAVGWSWRYNARHAGTASGAWVGDASGMPGDLGGGGCDSGGGDGGGGDGGGGGDC